LEERSEFKFGSSRNVRVGNYAAKEAKQNLSLYHVNVLVHLNVNVPELKTSRCRVRARLRARARSRDKFKSEPTGKCRLAYLAYVAPERRVLRAARLKPPIQILEKRSEFKFGSSRNVRVGNYTP
jgi:hypothetical protein